jgi:hypothetical protein
MAMSNLEKMKQRLKKSSPTKNVGQSISQRLMNDLFGKSKAMGMDDDPKGMMSLKKDKKTSTSKKKTTTKMGKSPGALGGKVTAKKGKVDVGLSEALRKSKKKTASLDKGTSRPKLITQSKKAGPTLDKKRTKVKATAANTKNYASTLAMQKKLIAKGAKIKADGIMGPKTRAAISKFLTNPSTLKKNKSKVMVDDFKKSNVKANKNKKAGIDAAKGDNKKVKNFKKNTNPKLDSKGNYKGTNIKPTKLQLERMKKRRARASAT